MPKINGDLTFIDTSGQIIASDGDLTLRADDTGSSDVIVGASQSLRPETDCESPTPIDLGREDKRWNTVYACSGNFENGLTVSGLIVEPGIHCAVVEFSASDGTDFYAAHNLDTTEFTWSMWRTGTDPIRSMLPYNISPSGNFHARVQLSEPALGKIVFTSCGGAGAFATIEQSGVNSLNSRVNDITISAVNDGITVNNVGQDIQLSALYTAASGACIQENKDDIATLQASQAALPSAFVTSVNTLEDDVTISSTNDGLVVNEVSQDIQLTPLFTAASGAYVDQAAADIVDAQADATQAISDAATAQSTADAALPATSGSVVRLNNTLSHYYLDTLSGSWTGIYTQCPFNQTVVEDSPYYTFVGSGQVQVNADGLYKVNYGVCIDQTAGGVRTTLEGRAVTNSSTEVPQSKAFAYSRQQNPGETSMSKTFFLELNDSDTIEVQCRAVLGSQAQFSFMPGTTISIELVRFL